MPETEEDMASRNTGNHLCADAGPCPHSQWRPEIVAFASLMEAQLRANDHKPGWKSDFASDLFPRVLEEAQELREAIEQHVKQVNWGDMALYLPEWTAKVGSEAADVANFAMMIADVCGAIPTMNSHEENSYSACPQCGAPSGMDCRTIQGPIPPHEERLKSDSTVETAPRPARLSPEEIADYHARFISCNEGFAEPDGLIRPAPHIDTPILLSHGREKALNMLLERLREPWEKMKGVAATKINRLLVDRREADAAIALLRKELADAERKVRSCTAAYESLVAEDTNFAQMVRDTFAEYGLLCLPTGGDT